MEITITNEQLKEMDCSQEEMLAGMYYVIASELTKKCSDYFISAMIHESVVKKKNLTAKQLSSLINYGNELFDEMNTLEIGSGKYTFPNHRVFDLYDSICKDFGIRQQKFDLVDSVEIKVKPNIAKMWCKDFVGKNELRPQLMYIYMDEERKTAFASDAHVLFSNPNEYVPELAGKLVDNDYVPTSNDDLKPVNYEFVIPSQENCQSIVFSEKIKSRYAMANAMWKNLSAKERKFSYMLMRMDDVNDLWINIKYYKLFEKAGLDGWEHSTSKTCVKRFQDGSLLLVSQSTPDREQDLTKGFCLYK